MSLAERDYCLPNFFGTLAAMTEPDLQRFGRLVRSRREELGIQQEEMDDHGGPSSTTMSRVERGIAPPSAKTLRKLDAGLRWQQGSAARVLEGGDPTPLMPGTVTEKPLRPTGQTTRSYPNADTASLIDSLNSIAGATEAMRPMLDDSDASQELRETLLLANEKFANTVMLAIVACELLGEQLASEDITNVANLGAFVSRLDGYVDQLGALRDAVRRMDRALYRGELTTKEEDHAVSSDATKEPPASTEAVEDQKTIRGPLPHEMEAAAAFKRAGRRLAGEEPRVSGSEEDDDSRELGG